MAQLLKFVCTSAMCYAAFWVSIFIALFVVHGVQAVEEACKDFKDCSLFQVCSSETKTCVCLPYMVKYNYKCLFPQHIGASCQVDAQCGESTGNSECNEITKRCECKKGYKRTRALTCEFPFDDPNEINTLSRRKNTMALVKYVGAGVAVVSVIGALVYTYYKHCQTAGPRNGGRPREHGGTSGAGTDGHHAAIPLAPSAPPSAHRQPVDPPPPYEVSYGPPGVVDRVPPPSYDEAIKA